MPFIRKGEVRQEGKDLFDPPSRLDDLRGTLVWSQFC